MDLLQEVLCGKNPELALHQWQSSENSQYDLKTTAEMLIKDLPEAADQLTEIMKNSLFSLDLVHGLIQKAIDMNSISLIEAIVVHKGSQIEGTELGNLFVYLLDCQNISNRSNKPNYKPIKAETKRQNISLSKKDKYRYYILGLLISNTKSTPVFTHLPASSISFFNFVLRYLLWHTSSLHFCPDSSRFLQFLNVSLNYVKQDSDLDETLALINQHLDYKQKLFEIRNTLEITQDSLPVIPLSRITKFNLK